LPTRFNGCVREITIPSVGLTFEVLSVDLYQMHGRRADAAHLMDLGLPRDVRRRSAYEHDVL
jgi:hypothetical protein